MRFLGIALCKVKLISFMNVLYIFLGRIVNNKLLHRIGSVLDVSRQVIYCTLKRNSPENNYFTVSTITVPALHLLLENIGVEILKQAILDLIGKNTPRMKTAIRTITNFAHLRRFELKDANLRTARIVWIPLYCA